MINNYSNKLHHLFTNHTLSLAPPSYMYSMMFTMSVGTKAETVHTGYFNNAEIELSDW